MPRKIICILPLIIAILICGCSNNERREHSNDDTNYSVMDSYGIFQSDGEKVSELSQENIEYLTKLFENAKWRKGMLKYHYDYVFVLPNATLEYTPDGAFYDRENDRSFSVPYEQRNEINEMFGLYTY